MRRRRPSTLPGSDAAFQIRDDGSHFGVARVCHAPAIDFDRTDAGVPRCAVISSVVICLWGSRIRRAYGPGQEVELTLVWDEAVVSLQRGPGQ